MYIIKGFSLIELMVVVAIVGLLSSVAFATYKSYTIRANFIAANGAIRDLYDSILLEYSKTGSFPATIEYNGVTVQEGSWAIVELNNVYSLFYDDLNNGRSVFIGFNFTGLEGMDGYTAPVGASDASKSAVFYAIYIDSNGIVNSACGLHSPGFASYSPNLEYLPQDCQCTTVYNFALTGSGC